VLELALTPPAGAILSADILLAADCPDRLDLELGEALAEHLEPGAEVRLSAAGQPLFAGVVDRVGLRLDGLARRWFVTAHAAYEARRRMKPRDCYYHESDAEIARRIASELGLEPRVEATHEVHARLERDMEPLRFLRGRARLLGFDLAVSAGALYFASAVPPLETPPLRLDLDSGLIRFEAERRGAAGRGGRFEVAGGPAWRPLCELEVRGLGEAWEGRYRVVRSRHHLSAAGYTTCVDFLEQRLDYELWSEGETA
jgi:phage protein D